MAPTPAAVLAAIKGYGIRYELVDGWDDPKYQRNAGMSLWSPRFVINHHTAGSSDNARPAASLDWMLRGNKGRNNGYVRACHFLVGRDGLVHVVYALGTWHAGKGGPFGGVPKDEMNNYAYGIEVESAGKVQDFTVAQIDALARLDAALCDLLGVPITHAINHRTWAPDRKVDTKYTDEYLQANAARVRAAHLAIPTHPSSGGAAPTPAALSGLKVTTVTADRVNFAWAAGAGATSWIVTDSANPRLRAVKQASGWIGRGPKGQVVTIKVTPQNATKQGKPATISVRMP